MLGAGAAVIAAGAASGAGPDDTEAPLVIAVPGDVLEDYQRFLNGRDPSGLTDFGGPFTRRDVVEVVLLQLALKRGGMHRRLELQGLPTAARIHKEIAMGNALCSATSFWSEDVQTNAESIQLSKPLLVAGQFEAGLYALASNAHAMRATSLKDVQQLSALSNRDWVVDWRTLERLGITNLQHVSQWAAMPRMVARGRADFLLAPFQANAGMVLNVESVQLVPIPRLKVGLQGTRHFLVSKSHPQGASTLERLNKGLAQLHSAGLIHKAYVQSGFFNPLVAQWTPL